ncbi:MAG: hypothetical protein FRX49_10499 [Trebouxia sp. A1-2]|nr:MAG: hypothetical protein FRX49_10499 [Trebouxia sp. A1-2]
MQASGACTIERYSSVSSSVAYKPGEVIAQKGEDCDTAYVVVNGTCDLLVDCESKEDSTAAQAVRGDAVALANMMVASLSYTATIVAGPGGATLGLLRRSQLTSLMSQALQVLPEELCHHLAARMTHVQLAAGSIVFEEDEIGDGMYIVLSGQCQIRARPSHAATIPQQQAVPLSSLGVDAKLTGSGQSTDSDGSKDEVEREVVQAAPRTVRSDAEHSASFWIHKYMQQARKLVQAAEAEDEISGLPLPLLARAAGHWKARTDHRHKDPAPAAVTFDKPLSPLEELMGRGAARAAQNQAGSRATGHPFAAVGQDPMDSATAVTQPSQQSFAAALSAVPLDAAVASESAQPSLVQPHSDSVVASELLVHSSADVPLIVTSIGESQPQPVDLTGLVATAVDSSEHTQEPVQGLADPNKRLFAKMGCEVPGHVSMQLLQEVGARSHVQGLLQEPFNYALLCCAGLGWAGLGCAALRRAVLCCTVLEVTGAPTIGLHIAQEVAGQVRKHHDGPKGVSRRQSFKLSHVIENRLARGGSGQGFGPHATQANTLTPLEALSEEPTPQQVCHDADNKQYLNSGDNLEVMKVEFCGNADTHLLKIQACLSWSVTATQIRLLASASGMPIYILAGVSATIIEAHNMMQALGYMHGDAAKVEATNTTDDSHTDVREAHSGQGRFRQGSLVQGQDLDACFGKVIRIVKAGDSFGELALLQTHARRTATVIACVSHAADSGQPPDGQITKGVDLVRIGRQDYDLTVRALQQQQLEDLVGLLHGVLPFAGLTREQLTSLAIFVRPVEVPKDQVIVKQGDPADAFYLIKSGQVLLTAALDSRDNMSRTATPLTNLARPSSFRRSFTRSSSLSNATQLALLGPGDSFGDEVCGLPTVEEDSRLDPDQVQQGSLQQPLVHLARVTASQACSLVTLSALDLARFGPALVTGMQQYGSTRREWRNHRMASSRNAARGLEVLMENVTSVGFTSCALRHNAKLPDLELAGGPAATGPAQALLERPPSRGMSSRPQSDNRLAQENSYEGSTSLSLQHVLAGCSTAATPRPSQPDVPSPGPSRPVSANKPPRPTSAGGRPLSGRLRPTSATLTPIMEDLYASQDYVMSGRASPLFPEAATAYKVAGSRPTSAKWSKSRAGAQLTTSLQEQLNQKMGKLAFAGVMQGGDVQPIISKAST